MPAKAKEGRAPLYVELAQEFLGAVADCEEMKPSERARWLSAGVGLSTTAARWGAWVWFALFVLSVVAVPALRESTGIAAANLDHRDALFVVLAVALAGPIIVGLSVWLSLFAYRILVDLLAKRLPRAFRPWAAPAIGLAVIAFLWPFRFDLRFEYWYLFREFLDVLELAGRYTPVSG